MEYTIALGITPKELSPPYSPQLVDKISSFHELLKTRKNVIECEGDTDGKRELKELYDQGIRKIEILGSWAQACVTANISDALELGMTIHVPDDGIFYDDRIENFLPIDILPLDLESNVARYIKNVFKNNFKFQHDYQEGIHIFTPQ